MIISALSFSIMAAVVKATSHSVAVKAFSRQIFSCIIVLSIIFMLTLFQEILLIIRNFLIEKIQYLIFAMKLNLKKLQKTTTQV